MVMLALLGGYDCSDIKIQDLWGLDGTLDLSQEGITAINPLFTQALSGLEALKLNSNELTQVPAEAYANLVDLTELYLNDNEISQIGVDAFNNMPSLQQLHLDNNKLIAIDANHFSNLTNLASLYLNSNQIASIDDNAFSLLPALTSLHLHNNAISSLSQDVLNDLTSLDELLLYNNQITTLDVGAFDNFPLTRLDLSNNSLTSIPKDLFVNHPNPENLANFNLLDNPFTTPGDPNYKALGWEITDVSFAPAGLKDNYRLRIDHALPGDLSVPFNITNGFVEGEINGTFTIPKGGTISNLITVVPKIDSLFYILNTTAVTFDDWSGHIGGTSLVNILDDFCTGVDDTFVIAISQSIGGNDCLDVSSISLSGLDGTIDLTNQGITSINSGVSQSLTAAQKLIFNTNDIADVPEEAFSDLTAMIELNLNNNDIATIGENAFVNMTSLYRLELINNELTQIPSNLYSNHPNLERLYLDKNSISTIAADAFVGLPKLDRLRLQDNSISALSVGIFDSLPLTYVDLHNNNLASLPKHLFANHPSPESLVSFNIAENPLTTVGDAAYKANGWEITDAAWVESADTHQYWLSIDHALPFDFDVSFTVTNGTIAGSSTGTVTIAAGSTISDVITVLPAEIFLTYRLTSHVAQFSPWSGHIGSTQLDAENCDYDPNLIQVLIDVLSVSTCSEITQSALSNLSGTLDLSSAGLLNLDADVMQALTSVTSLRFSENPLTSLPADAFANLGNLQSLWINSNSIATIGENAFANLSNINRLELIGNELTQIPSNLYSNLSKLQRLYLDRNSISSIAQDAFDGLPKLAQLRLHENNISQLPDGVFDNLPLTYLDLADNNLTSIQKDLFVNHPNPSNLVSLDIAGNPFTTVGNDAYLANGWEITDAEWINDGSAHQYRLRIGHRLPQNFTISYTIINGTRDSFSGPSSGTATISKGYSTIPVITVVPALNATSYSLSSDLAKFSPWKGHIDGTMVSAQVENSGSYCSLDVNILQALFNTLSIGHCSEITDEVLINFSNDVDFSSQGFTEIPSILTQLFTSADTITVADNDLTSVLPNAFANYSILTELYLHDNDISSIGTDAFANMSSLARLALQDNDLTEIPANLYSNHANLQLLYLYNNNIASIAAQAFTNLPKLATLRLQNNNISELSAGVFDGLKATEVNLSDNGLTSLPLNLLANHGDLSKLTNFDITNNPLTTVDDAAYLVDGWEITNASWISAGPHQYKLSIGHALPANLLFPVTLINGTVGGDTNVNVTIAKGSTSSDLITVIPLIATSSYSLSSQLTAFDSWSGHIGTASLEHAFDNSSIYCSIDANLLQELLTQLVNTHCSEITASSLSGLVGDVVLSSQGILAIDPSVTQALSGATTLRLEVNNLTSIPAQSFANLTGLAELYLYENDISSIGTDAFANMSGLSRLALRDNNLTAVAADLYSNLPSLRYLYLYNNNIASIASQAFTNLPKLERLRLYNNSISELPEGIFDGLNAAEIDLSDNGLTALPKDLFVNHPSPENLVTFDIAENPLTTLGDPAYNAIGWEITDAQLDQCWWL